MHIMQWELVIRNCEAMLHTEPYTITKIGNTFKTHVHCTKCVAYLALTNNKPLQQDMEMDHKHI
jgi:hypothetical protein